MLIPEQLEMVELTIPDSSVRSIDQNEYVKVDFSHIYMNITPTIPI